MPSTPQHAAFKAAPAALWSTAICAGLALAFHGVRSSLAAPAIAPATGPALVRPADPVVPLRYDRDIRPLLSDRCFKCHGPDAATRKAGLRLDQFESATAEHDGEIAIVPGDINAGELWKRINSSDPDEQMPPPSANKKPLSAEERDMLRRWIEGGAKYEPHWSFVPPARQPVPSVKDAAWCKGDIDRFILARLESENIAPSPEADPATLCRRIFLDLTGLPPTPEESDAYLADTSPTRFEALVDRLLTQEPYRTRTAERLASPWLDAARYADTCGIHTDNGRQIWSWRDWVLAAFRDNMPYDRFVTEQLAGDLLPNATVAQKVASGFNRNHVTTDEGGAIAEEYLVEYAVDRATTTATAFLGLTMGCARCHDHKFDPISNQDFYSFYAFFNSIDEPGLYSQTPDSNRAHEPFMEVPTDAQRTRLESAAAEVADLKKQQSVTSPEEDKSHADFLAGFPSQAGVNWAKTQVLGACSRDGAVLTPQPDQSVLASGENPPMDVHEIILHASSADNAGNSAAGLKLLLLEALGDPSFAHGRVGRAFNGNAVLSGIDIESYPHDHPDQARRHDIQWLWADVSQTDGDYRFTNLLVDNKGSDRGWAVDAHRTPGDRHLLVILNEPIPSDPQTDIRVRLHYETTYTQHVFGRVRLTFGTITDAAKLPVELGNFWLTGPFPSDPANSPYAGAAGPESVGCIDFKQNFGAGNQFWRYVANLRDGALVTLADGNNVTYLGRLIVSPVARELPVSIGSDDGFVLYANGKEVARHEIDRGLMAEQDKAVIPLNAGVNLVVLKIVNTGGTSGYYFKSNPSDDAYPHDLVAALLPAESRTPQMTEKVRQAWRARHSPAFRERQARIEALDKEIASIHAMAPKTMIMKELDMPRPTFVLTRGQYDQPDKNRPVTRAVPAALGKLPEGAPANRLGLAQWLVSPENPLAARVAVNRLWEVVFGSGLERTSEDFGQQGEWPSHPELLDFLAADFRDSGWDMRRTIRAIVTSATYRQSSAPRADLHERDPDNRLLAHYPRRRQTAEQVRDHALYVSGLLVEKLGGPSVKTYQPDGLWKEGALPGSNSQVYERGKGDDLYRRSLYTYWKRAVPPPSLQAFDAPTREYCVVRRPVTGTPLQALVLWNDPQFVEAARVLAERTMSSPGDDAARLTVLFRRCTGQKPDAKELASLTAALATARVRFASGADDAAKLLSVGEKMLPENADKPELAAWTLVSSAVMNLYRTTTQE